MVLRFFIFVFLFRTNGKKEHLDESDFHYSYAELLQLLDLLDVLEKEPFLSFCWKNWKTISFFHYKMLENWNFRVF